MTAKFNAGIFIAFSFLFLSACVSTSFTPALSFETRNAVPTGAVLVIGASAFPPSYQTLGEIEAWVTGLASLEKITCKARERAASIGADAIIVNSDMLWAEPGGRLDPPSENKLVYVRFTAIRLLAGESSPRNP